MSGEKRYTPGPWKASFPERSNGYWCISGSDSLSGAGEVATCYSGDAEANARLIAAAPDLLEALEHTFNLANHFQVNGVYFTEYDTNRAALEAAERAIAKAYGEDPE